MEENFLELLRKKAKSQAAIEQSSPLPVWLRPFFSVIGMHYWQFLLVISGILAMGIAIWFFPTIYESYYRL